MKETEQSASYCCSFCGKASTEIAMLVAGPRVFICDECVYLCLQIVIERSKRLLAIAQMPATVEASSLKASDHISASDLLYLPPFPVGGCSV